MSKSNKNETTVGVKEIARRANVSIATVDRVIHNRTGVSESTKKKIQQIIKEIDYQPNILASRLASRKVYELAILIPHVSEETTYWKAPLQGIERAEREISKYGINIHKYLFDLNSKSSFVEMSEQILQEEFDGILLAPIFIEEATTFAKECKEKKIPYVFINSDIPNLESLCYIGPDLPKSGYLVAHLMSYAIHPEDKVLVVNISKEIDQHHHLLRKEEGFRAYFEDHHLAVQVVKVDIKNTDYAVIEKELKNIFKQHPDIKAVFATNSRVGRVARFFEDTNRKDILLVGFDFLPDNIEYLKRETINFLICQKPEDQAYRGIMALYQYLVMSSTAEKVHHMPIDIITKENYAYYTN
ncbi:substrate-binding domain-containing protein [Porifericola rhodea]|uniref:LacI family DNA-binding transcriptional regulator n=1 Tax=Porifericola rhodea TaxID=930972 RepID=UPI002666BABA|nr:substrate-binding domain-containing protein [Porifericola rhodea]WKN30845.1 substrate-binding domain-containing protein [Porifericola rhodea]